MSSPSKRREMDLMKLMMSDFEVCIGESDSASDFYVKFHAPKDSLYEGGIYRIHVTLPVTYPYKSPSIGFQTKIFHPNVDEASGSVCLDVINQTWSPMYDLVNIFSVFLPQLLLYPNPSDPLNGAAAALMFKDPEAYKQKIREHVRKHASVDFKLSEEDEDEEEEDEPEEEGETAKDGDEDAIMSDMDADETILSDLDDIAADDEDGIKAQA